MTDSWLGLFALAVAWILALVGAGAMARIVWALVAFGWNWAGTLLYLP